MTEEDVLSALHEQVGEAKEVLAAIPATEEDAIHAPYSWTVKQVWAHCLDTERVFGYRALRFAVGDATELPGFDQDLFADQTSLIRVPLADLVDEWVALRHSHVGLFRRLDEDARMRSGLADGKRMSVRAIAFIMVGHVRHHLDILQKRLQGPEQA